MIGSSKREEKGVIHLEMVACSWVVSQKLVT